MEIIKNTEFGGERPLYASHDLKIENVVIHTGESAIKECANINAVKCRFEGKYPFWHVHGLQIEDCEFTPDTRAALWYCSNVNVRDSLIAGPKALREMNDIELTNVRIPDAIEAFWHCKGVRLRDVETANAEYIFMNSSDIDIDGYRQQGKYSFQYARNITIRNAEIRTKDAFWETENVTVYDSVIIGEYLGWHSKNLRLVNCRIAGTQPLCYAENLIMENCTMDADADLAFENSTVQATIKGNITSIKNPISGRIQADSIGEIILDEHIWQPADCQIITND